MQHVIFTGGGTAGHLFPGLAVASELADLRPDVRIMFVGSGAPIEQRLVEAAGYRYLSLPSRALPKSPWQALQFVGQNAKGCWQAARLLHHLRAAAVVGLGGFASVPLARAAIAAEVPLVLLEQNAVAGRATRWLAPGASLICTAFDLPPGCLNAGGPVRVTGNPIRAGFVTDADAAAQTRPRLIVLGGSQGARALNRYVPLALRRLRKDVCGWEIVHQSGPRDCHATQALYAQLRIQATVTPFIDDMPAVLAGSNLAISRAGGTTLAELAAAAVPAVLIPYPHATDDHQLCNAEHYAARGGCIVVEQNAANHRLDASLAAELAPLLRDPHLRSSMSAAMQEMARPDAAWKVATLVAEIAQPLHRALAA